jgi:hypothetical protein
MYKMGRRKHRNTGILNPFCLTKKRNYLFNKKEEYFSDLMKKEF